MYTKILRKIVLKMRRMAGHCDGSGGWGLLLRTKY